MNVGRGLTYGTCTCSVCSSLIPLTQDGATPLYVASQEGQSDIVSTLIRNGADINQPRKVGRGLTYGTLILYVQGRRKRSSLGRTNFWSLVGCVNNYYAIE